MQEKFTLSPVTTRTILMTIKFGIKYLPTDRTLGEMITIRLYIIISLHTLQVTERERQDKIYSP